VISSEFTSKIAGIAGITARKLFAARTQTLLGSQTIYINHWRCTGWQQQRKEKQQGDKLNNFSFYFSII